MPLVKLLTLLALASPAAAQNKLDWTPDAGQALEAAAESGQVIFVSIGFADEARSEAILEEGFGDKTVIAQAALTLNVPAWTWALGEEKSLASFGEAEAVDHSANLARATSTWLTPNTLGTIAVPQHLWLNSAGEVLLSCPWEMRPEELSWCFDEALRRAGVETRPPAHDEARPPRRLLLGATCQIPEDDDLGRGLTEDELEPTMEKLKKGFVTGRQREDLIRIMFTEDSEGAEFVQQQIGLWDFGGNAAANLVDGSYALMGLLAPPSYLEILEAEAGAKRDSLREVIAVAYEQLGHPDGLKAVKKALKAEKSDDVRAEWVRALGACGNRDKSVAKQLIKLVEKDESTRVQLNAILALGHVLPQEDASVFLLDLATKPGGAHQQAAILALALGRERSARAALEEQRQGASGDALMAALDQAIAVLDGANLFELEEPIRAIDGSELRRLRLFFRPKFEIPESGGGGSGEDGGPGRGPGGGD